MKKIILYSPSILVLLFLFHSSKANIHTDMDSILPNPLYLNAGNTKHPTEYLFEKNLEGKNTNELKKFIFSIAVTPKFETTIPPAYLYFEHGIAGLASVGISFGGVYDSRSEIDYHAATISLGVRGCGYVLPIISKISGKEINNFGFQPYLGVVYDYYITAVSIGDNDINPANYSHAGLCAGTRWYIGKSKFALLGEYNGNGLGSSLRFGISLGR